MNQVRTELTFLSADDWNARRIGLSIWEEPGIGMFNPQGVTRIMMSRLGLNFAIDAKTSDVLATLETNLDRHGKIVKEARIAYVTKAEEVLKARLAEIVEGNIVSLGFKLKPPQDFSTAYKTAIEALKRHEPETIHLTADQVRYLLQDEWDWMDDFLLSNSSMSGVAREYAATKGLSADPVNIHK